MNLYSILKIIVENKSYNPVYVKWFETKKLLW